MRQLLFGCMLFNIVSHVWAFTWQDLWHTSDQQASKLMDAGQFTKAQAQFADPAWKAVAAFRAGNYHDASILTEVLKNKPDAYYNQGNALAHTGKLEAALNAYDKALAINPTHQDALYNRKIIADLLKKQKQNKQDQDKQDQSKQDQDKQEQDKQEQDKQEQDKQEQDKQEQDKQEQDKQDQDKQDQDKQDQDKQDQDKQEQDKQEQDKQEQDKHDQDKQDQAQSQKKREQQQAKEQWLRMIPDDPGGLMREKFLRDYLRRHQRN